MEKQKVQQIQNFAKKFAPSIIECREHLHQYPELSYQEYETSKYIQQKLTEWGITNFEVMAETGVVAIIEGKNPSKKVFALRADIDALPIQEANEVAYKSKKDGLMHACGHDVHTSSLLGCARILNAMKDEWEGTIKLIFQPGEEKNPGGASILIKEGVLENPAPVGILGQHVEPFLKVGQIGTRSGMFMASCDELHVTVRGKGGHGARPHECVDTVLLTAHLIIALQQIVSRNIDPIHPAVLTIGKIDSMGGATNIIPNEVKLKGTFRAFNEDWRNEAHRRMKAMAEQLCESMGGECDFVIDRGYPSVTNEAALTQRVMDKARVYLGTENVIELPPRMGGEDFGYYAQELPACFYRLGVDTPSKTGLHTPTFDIRPEALEVGMGLMAWLAINELSLDD